MNREGIGLPKPPAGRENLDMIAANEVSHTKGFDCEDNHLIVLWREARRDLGAGPKIALARELVQLIANSYAEARQARQAREAQGTVSA